MLKCFNEINVFSFHDFLFFKLYICWNLNASTVDLFSFLQCKILKLSFSIFNWENSDFSTLWSYFKSIKLGIANIVSKFYSPIFFGFGNMAVFKIFELFSKKLDLQNI